MSSSTGAPSMITRFRSRRLKMSARGSIPASSMWGRTISDMDPRLSTRSGTELPVDSSAPGSTEVRVPMLTSVAGHGNRSVVAAPGVTVSALDAAEDDRHALVGAGGGAVGGQEAGQTCGAGRAHRDGRREPDLVGPCDRRLGGHESPAARAHHHVADAEPVVRLIVEDPVGGRVWIVPRRHQLAPVGG